MIDPSIATQTLYPALQEAVWLPEENEALQERLWLLLSQQVQRKTQGDHSSLREEDAAALLDSMLFSLRYYLYKQGLPIRMLLTENLSAMLVHAQDALRLELQTAKTLYTIACKQVVTLGSRSLMDTLAGVDMFFASYDYRLHAQDIPGAIDYQLCHPIDESWRGVLYIRQYLEHLLTENKLITCFALPTVEKLLLRNSPDYRMLLVNLYEVVAPNVIGLELLGLAYDTLYIEPQQAEDIHTMLSSIDQQQALHRLKQASNAVCKRLQIHDALSISHLQRMAIMLYPRIMASDTSAYGVFSVAFQGLG